MRYPELLAGLSLTGTIAALSIPRLDFQLPGLWTSKSTTTSETFLVELAPGQTEWITEERKWALKREGINFIDITDYQDFGPSPFSQAAANTQKVQFPKEPVHNDTLQPLLKQLSEDNMRTHLEKLTSFYTRYYKSESGAESSAWLLSTINKTISASGTDASHGVRVEAFPHSWGQSSIIATIPGQSPNTIIVGAHQDSINLFLPSLLAAPGADDDGSGTVTIIEAFRVLLTSLTNVTMATSSSSSSNSSTSHLLPNTVEFHWYSAEEGGLLGSQAIFSSYAQSSRQVKAMLQQDMTGYIAGTLAAGKPEAVGVITDFVDPGLTTFIKQVITAYCDIPYVETKCGYACSDHASASKAGYPSAFVIESEFGDSDKRIHTMEDKLELLDFGHMRQHAKLTLGLAYELARAEF